MSEATEPSFSPGELALLETYVADWKKEDTHFDQSNLDSIATLRFVVANIQTAEVAMPKRLTGVDLNGVSDQDLVTWFQDGIFPADCKIFFGLVLTLSEVIELINSAPPEERIKHLMEGIDQVVLSEMSDEQTLKWLVALESSSGIKILPSSEESAHDVLDYLYKNAQQRRRIVEDMDWLGKDDRYHLVRSFIVGRCGQYDDIDLVTSYALGNAEYKNICDVGGMTFEKFPSDPGYFQIKEINELINGMSGLIRSGLI